VIVSIFETRLQHVVVNITYRQFGLDLFQSQRFELQVGHRSRGVLSERLIDFNRYILAGLHPAVDKVG